MTRDNYIFYQIAIWYKCILKLCRQNIPNLSLKELDKCNHVIRAGSTLFITFIKYLVLAHVKTLKLCHPNI